MHIQVTSQSKCHLNRYSSIIIICITLAVIIHVYTMFPY